MNEPAAEASPCWLQILPNISYLLYTLRIEQLHNVQQNRAISGRNQKLLYFVQQNFAQTRY